MNILFSVVFGALIAILTTKLDFDYPSAVSPLENLYFVITIFGLRKRPFACAAASAAGYAGIHLICYYLDVLWYMHVEGIDVLVLLFIYLLLFVFLSICISFRIVFESYFKKIKHFEMYKIVKNKLYYSYLVKLFMDNNYNNNMVIVLHVVGVYLFLQFLELSFANEANILGISLSLWMPPVAMLFGGLMYVLTFDLVAKKR